MLLVFILAVSGALFISFFCSLFEAILLSLSATQVELFAEKHPAKGGQLRSMKQDINQPITAILTLNTLAHTIGASVAGAAAVSLFGEQGLIWFSLLFTLAILLFTEILPKTMGVNFASKLGPYIVFPLRLLIISLKPLIFLAQLITKFIPGGQAAHQFSTEELRTIATLSRKSGVIQADQEAVIANILQLGQITARDVMTPRTVTFSVPASLTIKEAAHMEDRWRMHSRVPVYDTEPDNVVGLMLSQDVLLAAAEQHFDITLAQLMRPVHFVPETAPADRIFLEFFEKHQHLFVVVDEYGSVTGVISMEDILEEIIGREIVDESDTARNMRELARLRRKKRRTD
ncbi:MAG: hemolysin family protein [Desulfobulbus sp.]